MKSYDLQHPFVPCSALIFLDEKGVSNTYCQRERGHSGKHNVVDEEPVEEKVD